MINLIVNSGHSFFSLRKSLVKYLLNKDNVTLYVPNNKNKIAKEINSQNLQIVQAPLGNRWKVFKETWNNSHSN